jgi:hypothetical protein
MDSPTSPIDETQPIAGPGVQGPAETHDPVPTSGWRGVDPSAMAIWLVVVVARVGFILLGRVTIHGNGFEGEMRVVDVWREMANELPDVSRPIILRIVYVLALFATLAGALAALFIALIAREPEPTAPLHISPGNEDGTVPEPAGNGG